MKIQINNEVRDATAEEIENLNNLHQKYLEQKQARIDEANAKATAQVSGNQKLLDLGLTQAEATALTGYAPPVEE